MKKRMILAAALAALLSTPAMANIGGPHHESGYGTRCREVGENVDHCQRVAWRGKRDREFFVQSGTDLNSHRWLDGSPRSTLPPHASRGSERSSTDPDSGYWVKW